MQSKSVKLMTSPSKITLPTSKDLLILVKPGITRMAVIMAAGGFALAPNPMDWGRLFAALIGTALAVAAANVLNMYWEREGDLLMERTRDRPLPAGRMSPIFALVFGLVLQVLSIVVLTIFVNPLTAFLGTLAFCLYVLVYTPLKRISPLALPVGSIPGAMPSLMGWVAATGFIDLSGLLYTAILFFWQLPHFLAIAMFRQEEYRKAGIKVTPIVRGEKTARIQAIVFSAILVLVSLTLLPAGAAGWIYTVVALGVGGWFFWQSMGALDAKQAKEWPRRFFFASLIYLPTLALGLTVDAILK